MAAVIGSSVRAATGDTQLRRDLLLELDENRAVPCHRAAAALMQWWHYKERGVDCAQVEQVMLSLLDDGHVELARNRAGQLGFRLTAQGAEHRAVRYGRPAEAGRKGTSL